MSMLHPWKNFCGRPWLATSTASISTGATEQHLLTVKAWTPGQPWAAARLKGSSQFLVSPMKRRHNPYLAFASTINKLTGRCGHSSRLLPISSNSTASQLLKIGTHKSPPGSSASSCPTYGRSQHLREIISLAPSRQRCLLPPSRT